MQRCFDEFSSKLEERIREGDQFAVYKNLKVVNMELQRALFRSMLRTSKVDYCVMLASFEIAG